MGKCVSASKRPFECRCMLAMAAEILERQGQVAAASAMRDLAKECEERENCQLKEREK